MRGNKGFSAIEITIATVVVGVLAALTLPKLPTVIENQKVSASKKVLYDLYAAQKRYFINHGTYASSINDLDTKLKAPDGFSLSVANNSGQIALLQRGSKSYGLGINASGTISCSGTGCNIPILTSHKNKDYGDRSGFQPGCGDTLETVALVDNQNTNNTNEDSKNTLNEVTDKNYQEKEKQEKEEKGKQEKEKQEKDASENQGLLSTLWQFFYTYVVMPVMRCFY